MPFHFLLSNLLVDVPGAQGAIFLDPEGETVEFVTRQATPYELKVAGAYQGLLLRAAGRLVGSTGGGELQQVAVAGRRLKVLTQRLKGGYYLVLLMEAHTPLALAAQALDRTGQALNQEIP